MDRYQELAAKVEQASGPDREIDAAIAVQLGEASNYEGDGIYGCKRYTASMDAAFSIIPDRDMLHWSLSDTLGAYGAFIGISGGGWVDDIEIATIRWAKTPALALCAAGLRARSYYAATPPS